MRFIHPKYFFSPKFSPKSRCGLYANAGYTPLSTVVTFSVLETSHYLACTFYEFVKVCRCFYATNENIHVLSMKFPHLFLRPEIIITFLWGWEWSGGQVGHRSPWNSGFF